MLAAAFLSTAVAVAGPIDDGAAAAVGDAGGLTVGDLTFVPTDDTSSLPVDFGAAPFIEEASGPVDFNILDNSGDVVGSFETNVDVSNYFGIENITFAVPDDTDILTAEVEAALTNAGFSNLDFDQGTVSDVADALVASDVDLTDGDVTATEVDDALSGTGISYAAVDTGDVADAVNAADFTGTDEFESVLTDAGYTDASFAGDATVGDAAAALGDAFDATDISNGVTSSDVETALGDIDLTGGQYGLLSDALNAGDYVTPDSAGAALDDYGFADLNFTDPTTLEDAATALADDSAAGFNIDEIATGVDSTDVDDAFSPDSITLADLGDADVATAINAGDYIPPDEISGSLYSVTNFGDGLFGEWANVYVADPGVGDAPADVTDTFVTPLGNFDITWLTDLLGYEPFDIDAGGAFGNGIDLSSGGGLFGGLFSGDLFGGLFGGGGGSGSDVITDASASQIQDVLEASSTDFGGYDSISVSDIASSLATSSGADDLGGGVTATEVSDALSADGLNITPATEYDAGDIADTLNGADVADDGGGLFGDLFGGLF